MPKSSSERTEAEAEVLLQRLQQRLDAPIAGALRLLEQEALRLNVALFLVGGAVRDLLLDRGHVDLDLAVEGDVEPLARALAADVGGRCVLHPRFGTASVSAPGLLLDLARTRSETYERPGALPDVRPDTLLADLARRDFSINAMALRLSQPRGEIIDPFGGRRDLATGVLRILHEASFRDDPTRILRGLRYSARLQARFERRTARWLRRDLPFLHAVSGPRLRRELALLFEEERAPEGVRLAQELRVPQAMLGVRPVSEPVLQRWQDALAGPHQAPADELGFCLLLAPRDFAELERFKQRLHLLGRLDRVLGDFVRLRGASDKLAAVADAPVGAVDLLDGFAPAAVWAVALLAEDPVAQACESYLRHWRRVRPRLDGHDLQALGLSGAAVGVALKRLRSARLAGEVHSREDEERLATALAGGEGKG